MRIHGNSATYYFDFGNSYRNPKTHILIYYIELCGPDLERWESRYKDLNEKTDQAFLNLELYNNYD